MDELLQLREEMEEAGRRAEEAWEAHRQAAESMAARFAAAARDAEYVRRQLAFDIQAPAFLAIRELIEQRVEMGAQIAEAFEQQKTSVALAALAARALRDVSFQEMRDLAVRLSQQQRVFEEVIYEGSVGAIDLDVEVATPEEVYDVPGGGGGTPADRTALPPPSEVWPLIQLTLFILWAFFGYSPDQIRSWILDQASSRSSPLIKSPSPELRETKRNAPIREDASGAATEVGRVSAGQIVSVLDEGGRWCRVRTLDLQEGWIFKGHLRRPE